MKAELTQWTNCIGKKGPSSRPSLTLHDNEQPVDNYMTKRWITHDENMNSPEVPTIHEIHPQGYPRALLNYFMHLSDTIHCIHRYNNSEQQHFNYLSIGRNAVFTDFLRGFRAYGI